MLLTDIQLVLPDRILTDAYLEICEGKISDYGLMSSEKYDYLTASAARKDVFAAAGAFVMPGFIDIHHHGNHGADICDATEEALATICRGQLKAGVTTFLGTVITSPIPTMTRAAENIRRYRAAHPEGNLWGIHYEGPFLNPLYAGAQNRSALCTPEADIVTRLLNAAGDDLKMITLAPEMPGTSDIIGRLSNRGIRVALGHTAADSATAREAFACGAAVATHLFNAMRPLHHREPGIIGEALINPAVFTEVILDGLHVHPDTVRLILAAKGFDRTVGISDAMRASGMPDGPSELGGQAVLKQGLEVRLPDGTLAGSALTQDRAMHFLRETVGLDLPAISRVLSTAPAAAMGLTDRGILAIGKRADLLFLDHSYRITRRMIGGKFVTENFTEQKN